MYGALVSPTTRKANIVTKNPKTSKILRSYRKYTIASENPKTSTDSEKMCVEEKGNSQIFYYSKDS